MKLESPMRKGQKIVIKEIPMGGRIYTPRTYIVVADYSHHTVVKDSNGFLKSITHAELLQLGYAKQPPKLECWRK